MTATLSFREALNKGIVSGTLVDTKIILFSRRDSAGRVYGPKALYASSHVLKSVPYFNDREPLQSILAPSDQFTYHAVLAVLFGNFAEAEVRDFDGDIGGDESTAEDYGYYSDSDLEDDEDGNPNQEARTRNKSRANPSRQPYRSVGEDSYHKNRTELANKGKIVRIPDIAFVT